MAISERQLEIWSHQGAMATSASTYESLKNCISGVSWKSDVRYEVYLQGSYKNSTNIYGNSDVDIVIQFKSIFTPSVSHLSQDERVRFAADFSNATYSLANFKATIVKRLKTYYGEENVIVNDKAILVKGNGSNRLDADVIVCNTYRKYSSYTATSKKHVEGIIFKTEYTRDTVINYPKIHYANGVEKNTQANTYSNYKSVVRIIKNMKVSMIKKRFIDEKLAPSYFLECLIYNASNQHFRKNAYVPICEDIIHQLVTDSRDGTMQNYLVQNRQRKLFGAGDQQWNISDAKKFVEELLNFWKVSKTMTYV